MRHRPAAPLILAMLLSLAACSTRSIRHEVVPAEPEPPPRVDCLLPPQADVPAHPRTDDVALWTVWAGRVYGWVQGSREIDAREAACIADLKARGVIR